ncbi:phage tail protein [Dickeya solani]|uniref:phage tail-collar fiber domain-containing protein n=1 Tax=Dickeya solani TaxID=1089444 RepID=UPI0022A7B6A7|nr:phage tail protein [Dickeya solani]MCZ0791739.1 phage tail protein [Dickeya solani]
MGIKYFTLLTRVGELKLAEAISTGKPLEITQMGVGDGGGALLVPDPSQVKLINEKRRGKINSLTVDSNNANQIIAEQVIPDHEGGFWLREIGLYDADDNLIAVGNCPETYKPELKEGSGRIQTVRMILIVSRTDAVTLNIDPTVALATRRYADTLLTDHVAAANPHKQYAPIASPALIGNPTAPTAVAGTNTTQLATTAFVAGAINLLSGQTGNSVKLKLDINDIVGIPLPWPQATAPAGWLKCNGQAFDKNRYPRLAVVYPSGVLPDLRGEFIRGWDDGRGVDAGRAILSAQTGSLIVGDIANNVNMATLNNVGEATTKANVGWDTAELTSAKYPSIRVNIVSGQTATDPYPYCGVARPRNLAFNYIVRAA